MTHQQPNEPVLNFQSDLWSEQALASSANWQEALELLCEQGFGGLAEAMTILINEAMKLERSAVLGARPFERTPLRRGRANGFKPKTVNTRVGALELRVPQTRDVPFYPSALEKGQRSERALKLAIAEMYVQGVTTRKVTAVMQELCGLEVTSSQVSRAVQLLDAELTEWRERKLGEVPYVFLDARYENVRVNGVVVTCALLVAIGVLPNGKRTVLGLSVSLSEAEVHWRDFLATLQARGLHGVKLFVSDDHAGLTAALATRCAGVKWQRCQFHLGQNLLDHLPANVSQAEASADLRSVFNAANRQEADRLLGQMLSKYAPVSKKLAAWLETNVPQGLTVFDFPREHRRRLRTNNCVERLNREIKRRTRVATQFPNEASLLRLATAVLIETDEEWQTEKRYLPQITPPTAS
jgi:putative transposase